MTSLSPDVLGIIARAIAVFTCSCVVVMVVVLARTLFAADRSGDKP